MGIPLQLHLESKLYLCPDQGIFPFVTVLPPLLNPLWWLLEEDLVVEASTCQLQARILCQLGMCQVSFIDGWSTYPHPYQKYQSHGFVGSPRIVWGDSKCLRVPGNSAIVNFLGTQRFVGDLTGSGINRARFESPGWDQSLVGSNKNIWLEINPLGFGQRISLFWYHQQQWRSLLAKKSSMKATQDSAVGKCFLRL